jgi:hypothetical protein
MGSEFFFSGSGQLFGGQGSKASAPTLVYVAGKLTDTPLGRDHAPRAARQGGFCRVDCG